VINVKILSLTGLIDALVALGVKTLSGTCAAGVCSFPWHGINLLVPADLFLWGPLAVLTTAGIVGSFIFCGKGRKAMIKHLP